MVNVSARANQNGRRLDVTIEHGHIQRRHAKSAIRAVDFNASVDEHAQNDGTMMHRVSHFRVLLSCLFINIQKNTKMNGSKFATIVQQKVCFGFI